MKVLLVNGSPHAEGCTYTALREVADTLEKNGIETVLLQLGTKPLQGCIACGNCRKTGRCFADDKVNQVLDMLPEIDGIVVGSPVHYAGPAAQLTAFLDRLFYAGSGMLMHKPAAAVVSCRRGGATAAFDRLNKYFTINSMPIVSSQYWNQVHGNNADQVREDEEGMQTMRTLGTNMAWLLQCIRAGREAGVPLPVHEPKIATNYIR